MMKSGGCWNLLLIKEKRSSEVEVVDSLVASGSIKLWLWVSAAAWEALEL